jgi:hypothetical protein
LVSRVLCGIHRDRAAISEYPRGGGKEGIVKESGLSKEIETSMRGDIRRKY